MKIQDRLVDENDNVNDVLERINANFDADILNQRVNDFRKSSLGFLTNALEA